MQSLFMGGMEAELMSSAGQGGKLHPGSILLNTSASPKSNPQLTSNRVINLIGSVVGVQPKGKLNPAAFSRDDTIE